MAASLGCRIGAILGRSCLLQPPHRSSAEAGRGEAEHRCPCIARGWTSGGVHSRRRDPVPAMDGVPLPVFCGIKDVNWSDAYHAPLWLRDVSQHWFGSKTPIGWFYLVTGIVLFLLYLLLAPNANSLNRLYRDRFCNVFILGHTWLE